MLTLELMEIYGWDYQTYLNQPPWLIDLAIRKLDIQAKLNKAQAAETGA